MKKIYISFQEACDLLQISAKDLTDYIEYGEVIHIKTKGSYILEQESIKRLKNLLKEKSNG